MYFFAKFLIYAESLGMVMNIHRNYDSTQGHTGIVTGVYGNSVDTIEGNTNQRGSREGDGVYHKHRLMGIMPGLHIIGFVRIKECPYT